MLSVGNEPDKCLATETVWNDLPSELKDSGIVDSVLSMI